jgi:ArsR family transcriptional regulator
LLERVRTRTATALDVRPVDDRGHVAGAINVPLAQLERRFTELPSDREIVAYCRGPWCVLSFEAVALLRQRGYRVRRLQDGYPEWKSAGLPVSHTLPRRSKRNPCGGEAVAALCALRQFGSN